MSRDSNKYLVLLIDEHRVVVAAPGETTPTAIDLPGRWSDQTPELLGELLVKGLGVSRQAVGRVIVGVPVSWVLTQHMSVPSEDRGVTAGAVRMRVNRDYVTDTGDLVADYTTTRSDAGSDVLIGVTTRDKLRRLNEALDHAGLKAEAVYITAQAYAGPEPADAMVVRIQPPMAELALVKNGRTIGLRSLCENLSGDDPAGAARAISSSLASDPELSGLQSKMVFAADATTGDAPHTIATQLNGDNNTITITGESAPDALRRRAADDDMLDLLRGRATRETTAAWMPWQKGIAATIAVALIVLLSVGGVWWGREHRLSTLQNTAKQIQPQAESLGKVKQRLDQSAPWFDKRVDTLSCMLALTECVPKQDGLWLAEFRLNADLTGSLQGRSETRGAMLEFLRTIQATESFSGVALRDSAESQNGKREVRFEIVFTYTATRRAR
jgi:Tfp pilus assembly protein PilN